MGSSIYSSSTVQGVSPFRITQKCPPRHLCQPVCAPFPRSVQGFSVAGGADRGGRQAAAAPGSSRKAGGRRKCRSGGWRGRRTGKRVDRGDTVCRRQVKGISRLGRLRGGQAAAKMRGRGVATVRGSEARAGGGPVAGQGRARGVPGAAR